MDQIIPPHLAEELQDYEPLTIMAPQSLGETIINFPDVVIRNAARVSFDPNMTTSYMERRYKMMGDHLVPWPSNTTQSCAPFSGAWLFSGEGKTDGNGKAEVVLNNYLPCYPKPLPPASNVRLISPQYLGPDCEFLVTSHSETPVLVTHTVISNRDNAQFPRDALVYDFPTVHKVQIFSWDLDGTLASNTAFSWQAVVAPVTFWRL